MSSRTYETVIGLEVHAQLASKHKMFCPDTAEYGLPPNTQVSVITLAHPGVLPTINRECVQLAVRMGIALECRIENQTYFARKNYFYPDLPKGYQITQDNTPICVDGQIKLRLTDKNKTIRIQRIHIEEDAGKNYHDQDLYDSLVDFNRAGVGLIEIVTHPDFSTAEEAMLYLTEIRKLVRHLDICDGNMEEGSLRCDANISVMPLGATEYGTRVEVKNMNSISNVGRAINYEVQRQIELIESGGKVSQETRTWDAGTSTTIALRSKESSADYRYFPEPDLLPVILHEAEIEAIRAEMPELPESLFQRYTQEIGLPEHDATLLTEQKEFAAYFQALLDLGCEAKAASNWLNGSVKTWINENASDIRLFPLSPAVLSGLIGLVTKGKVSLTVARDPIFSLLVEQPQSTAFDIAESQNLLLVHNEDAIEKTAKELMSQNPDKVAAYQNGKTGLLSFFVGQIMKATGGKADPKRISETLERLLSQ